MAQIKASKGGRTAMIVFTVVGVLLLAGAIALGIFFAADNNSRVPVQATITEIFGHYDGDGDRSYDVYADFTLNGKEYEHIKLNYWDSGMEEGDVVTVYVDADDPESMGVPKVVQIIIPCALVFFGAAFTLTTYEQHAMSEKSDSKALSFVGVEKDGKAYWGAGIDEDVVRSSIKALVSALNNYFA